MKHVVITGSTKGIGLGMAKGFLDKGWSVTINGRRRETVDEVVQTLAETYDQGQLFGFPSDVRRADEIQALWDASFERFKRTDIWINNAGISAELAKFFELPIGRIQAVVETNILGTMIGTRVALQGMIDQGFGAIYNMEGFGSDGRRREEMTLYGTTKYALRYFNEAMAEEAAETPVIVGALAPGMIWTDLVAEQFKERPEVWERSKGILNIIMDRVETVSPWLVEQILANDKNGVRIAWLTRRKMIGRFLKAPFTKREIVA